MKEYLLKRCCLKFLFGIFLILLNTSVRTATPITTIEDQKKYFHEALKEIKLMLEGKIPMSYERAIFIMENAYWEGKANYETYQAVLDAHIQSIRYIIKANDHRTDFTPKSYYPNEQELRAIYKKALANEAIFHYMTDTYYYLTKTHFYKSYPFTYPFNDPLGTINWENTQVISMLNSKEKRGNCFALTSLFKIFSDRLESDAILCTAPGHIYIRHEDENGIRFNVELATKSFPGTGSMQTLTYTLNEAIVNGIALRNLNDKGEIALTLIYLAKSYQQKFNIVEDDFMLDCAETALKYDNKSLNALLLKAEILEERIIQQQKEGSLFQQYEQFIVDLYELGYREMPTEMKNIIIAGIREEPLPIMTKDHTPKAFANIESGANGYMTLSGGLFEEVHIPKPIEKYSRTILDTKTKKITHFVDRDTLYNNYPMDAVVFALSIDPLASKFPQLSPYAGFANNPILFIDNDGLEIAIKDPNTGKVSIFKPGNDVPDGSSQFVKNVYASLNHLLTNGGTAAVNVIDDLVNDNGFSVTISETKNFGSGQTSFSPKKGIAFNPYEGLIVGEENLGNNRQSPSLGLLHELDHANRHRQLLQNLNDAVSEGNKDKIKEAKNAINEFFVEDAEEERVVSGVERSAAKSLGEGFRNSYDDVKGIFKADGPTSTETGTPTKREQRQINKTNRLLDIDQ